MKPKQYSTKEILELFEQRYPEFKYKSKYPDVFSQKFEEFCDREIVPIFRKKLSLIKSNKHPKYLAMRIFGYISLTCMAISYFLIPVYKNVEIAIIAVSLFVFNFVFGMICSRAYFKLEEERRKKLKKEFENIEKEVFPVLFSYTGDIEYISSLSEKENLKFLLHNFHLGQLRGGIDVFHKDDFFKIQYKNLEIDVREVFLKEICDDMSQNGKVNKKGGFGVVFSIKTEKFFYGRTSIVRKILDEKYSIPEKFSMYEEAKLEDIEFSKLYKVLTENQQEARLFITPAFMSRLVKLTKKYPRLEIDISFERNNINVLFSDNKDRFELFMWKNYMSYEDTDINLYDYNIYRKAFLDLKESLFMLDELEVDKIL